MFAREWRVVLGAVSAVAVQLGAGLIYWGPGIFREYAGALLKLPTVIAAMEPDKAMMHSWRAFFLHLGVPEQAALTMSEVFPHIDFKREVTIGHLMLDVTSQAAELAKVNPPIRPREDVEYLWQALLAGELDWVVSDHACCRHETKVPKHYFGNIWMAKSGFGGTEYLLPSLVSEGTRRGMDYNHMARVTSWTPAQRFGLNRKGDIAEGYDADLALVDPARTWTIHAQESPSTQGYTPFEGLELSARVESTFLRGEHIYAQDRGVIGKPRGQYLFRPTD